MSSSIVQRAEPSLAGWDQWRSHVWALIVALAAVFAWLTIQLTPAPARIDATLSQLAWTTAESSAPPNADTNWETGEPRNLAGRAVWIRARIQLTRDQVHSGTVALSLSGPFSARVFLNGLEVGKKGQPALNAAAEIAGPIDAAIPIGHAAVAGTNELLIFLSMHGARHRPNATFHRLAIAPGGAEPRRQLSHYAVAVSQLGLLLAIAIGFLCAGMWRRDAVFAWAAAGAFCLIFTLGAETLRTIWNYPYPFHIKRLLLIWVGLSAFGACLLSAMAAREQKSAPWRFIAGAFALNAFGVLLFPGLDLTLASLTIFAMVGLFLAWRRVKDGDPTALALLGIVFTGFILALARPGQFVDNAIYILGAAALATYALRPVAKPTTPNTDIAADTQNAAIVSISAEGNYARIVRVGAKDSLVRQPLSSFVTGASLVRVHRSHIVNLTRARRLVSKTGSRYELLLDDGRRLPVSRKLVGEVRDQLARHKNAEAALGAPRTNHVSGQEPRTGGEKLTRQDAKRGDTA